MPEEQVLPFEMNLGAIAEMIVNVRQQKCFLGEEAFLGRYLR
jgi:hypothetical protein